jgi:nucleotide-binding universal stress UspA family protein
VAAKRPVFSATIANASVGCLPSRIRLCKRPGRGYGGWSPSTDRRRPCALKHAASLHRDGDQLGVIHVLEPGGDASLPLAEASRVLPEYGIDATPISLAACNPAHTICVTAEHHGYDTIVVGRRNQHHDGRVLLGSIAERVVAGAPGHVLVVA